MHLGQIYTNKLLLINIRQQAFLCAMLDGTQKVGLMKNLLPIYRISGGGTLSNIWFGMHRV